MTIQYQIRNVDGYRVCPICSSGYWPSGISGYMITPIIKGESQQDVVQQSIPENLQQVVDQAFFHVGCFMRYLEENGNKAFWETDRLVPAYSNTPNAYILESIIIVIFRARNAPKNHQMKKDMRTLYEETTSYYDQVIDLISQEKSLKKGCISEDQINRFGLSIRDFNFVRYEIQRRLNPDEEYEDSVINIALDGQFSGNKKLCFLSKVLDGNVNRRLCSFRGRIDLSKALILKDFIRFLVNHEFDVDLLEETLKGENFFNDDFDRQTFKEIVELAQNFLQKSSDETEEKVRLGSVVVHVPSGVSNQNAQPRESDEGKNLALIVERNKDLRMAKFEYELCSMLKQEREAMQSRSPLALTHQELQGKMQNLRDGMISRCVAWIQGNRRSTITAEEGERKDG